MDRVPSYQGSWWPSTDPTLVLGGTLVHTGKGYELEIAGSPQDIARLGRATIEGIPIYGHGPDGTHITVKYLPLSEMPGASSTTLYVEQAMLGIHSEAPQFEYALFEFRYLTAWSGRTSALRPVIEIPGGLTGITYSKCPDSTAAVGESTVTIGDAANYEASLDGDTVSRRAQFMVRTGEPVTFDELLGSYLRPLQHLMSFANNQGLAVRKLSLKPVGQRELVTPLFEPVFEPTEADEALWHPLFRLADVPGGFPDLIARWFDFYQRVQPLLDLLLLPRYVERIPFAEQSLLMYAQAAEGLHQRLVDRFAQYSLEPSDHEILMAELKSGVSAAESSKWARDRLARNDRSFKQRLLDLIEYAGPAVREILKPTPSQWASEMRNARDLWTHWSPTARRQLDSGQATRLSASLAAVLTSCILAELGFEDDLRAKIIRQSDDYRWAALLGRTVPRGT